MLNGTLVHDGPLGSLALDSAFFDGCTVPSIRTWSFSLLFLCS